MTEALQVFTTAEGWMALLTLTLLEIVLGIDNIIFISIVSEKLPEEQKARARFIGLSLAIIVRIILLFGITYIIGLTEPVFTVFGFEASWRDIILAAGGIFLIGKSTSEIHHKVEGQTEEHKKQTSKGFMMVIIQIILLDIVFSFDSILTAIGMTQEIALMIAAVVISMAIMMFFAGSVSRFIAKHPTLQVLALSFLILIGFMLMVEALHYHVPKGYIYFAVFFSLLVEMLNMRMRKKKAK